MSTRIYSFVLLIEFILAVPIGSFAQKTLRLDLEKGIEKEEVPLKSSTRAVQKLVRRMDFYEEGEHKTMSMYFEYDAQGRVVKTINKGYYYRNFFEDAEVLYNVNGNTLTVKSSPINGLTKSEAGEYAVCELNDMGYVEEATCMDPDGFTQSFSLIYDENGYPLTYDDAGSWGVYKEYSWVNGNLDKVKSGNAVWEYIYTAYENKANLDFNRMFDETFGERNLQMDFLGYFGKKDKNLLERSGDETFEYTFDEDGYVTKIKSSLDAVCTAEVFYDGGVVPDPTPNNPSTEKDLEDAIDNAPEGSEDSPTEIFIPSDGITLEKPLNINKHIRLKGGKLVRGNDNPYAMLRIRSGYSLELDDITIDGNRLQLKDGSLIVYGKLKLKDGVSMKNCFRTEADSPSGVICVAQGGILTMDGGSIFGNTGVYGSAVYCEGKFEMYDGEISSNQGQIGAVVVNAGGSFVMHGGKILGNKVTDGCGGVFVSDNCQFIMNAGEISGNDDCDIYSWADITLGSNGNVKGLTMLAGGNLLKITDQLKNNWTVAFVDDPQFGTVVAEGINSYRLSNLDMQHIRYAENAYSLKLNGNTIVIDGATTAIEDIYTVKVYTQGSSLFVQTPQREQVIVISMTGAVFKNEEQIGLKQYHGLTPGIYIVRVGEQVFKVRLK